MGFLSKLDIFDKTDIFGKWVHFFGQNLGFFSFGFFFSKMTIFWNVAKSREKLAGVEKNRFFSKKTFFFEKKYFFLTFFMKFFYFWKNFDFFLKSRKKVPKSKRFYTEPISFLKMEILWFFSRSEIFWNTVFSKVGKWKIRFWTDVRNVKMDLQKVTFSFFLKNRILLFLKYLDF